MTHSGVSTPKAGGSTFREIIGNAVLASLPILIVFWSVPIAIFVPNLIEFNYDILVIAPTLILGVGLFLFLLLLWFYKPNWGARLARPFFYLGIFVFLSDILAPVSWGLLDGTDALREPVPQMLVELFLLGVLAVCLFKLPLRFVRSFGIPATLVLFAAQFVLLAQGLREWSQYQTRLAQQTSIVPESNGDAANASGGRNVGSLPNIYHLVFDGYSAASFDDAVRHLGVADGFSGSTFFQRTLANYTATNASTPSFLTGTFYSNGSLREWQYRAKEKGLRRVLEDAGYEISAYVPDPTGFWMYVNASHVRTGRDIAIAQVKNADALRLAFVTSVRVAPVALRLDILELARHQYRALTKRTSKKLSTEILPDSVHSPLVVALARQFVAEEKDRGENGEYVYLHVILPHHPYVWDSECGYVGVELNRLGDTSYRDQVNCATRLMVEFTDELKRLGRFEDSLIIFQGDHGSGEIGFEDPDLALNPPPEVLKTIADTNVNAKSYFNTLHALLVVKPPHSDIQDLHISTAPAQLADIPATIYDLIGLDADPGVGQSVFGIEESASRDIHLYNGVSTAETATHLSFNQSDGSWRIYPLIEIER